MCVWVTGSPIQLLGVSLIHIWVILALQSPKRDPLGIHKTKQKRVNNRIKGIQERISDGREKNRNYSVWTTEKTDFKNTMDRFSGTFGALNIRAIKSPRKRDNRAEKLLEEIVTKTFQICQKHKSTD